MNINHQLKKAGLFSFAVCPFCCTHYCIESCTHIALQCTYNTVLYTYSTVSCTYTALCPVHKQHCPVHIQHCVLYRTLKKHLQHCILCTYNTVSCTLTILYPVHLQHCIQYTYSTVSSTPVVTFYSFPVCSGRQQGPVPWRSVWLWSDQ